MIKRTLLAACVVLGLAASSYATSVQLSIVSDDVAKSWTAYAQTSDANTKGIAAFQIDVIGTGGVTATRWTPTNQTNMTPTPPFSLLRTNGSAAGPVGISASQDVPTAVNDGDNTELTFGLGVGSKFPIAHGFWTGTSGFLTVQVTPQAGFNLFPSNFSAEGGAGTTSAAPFADSVTPATIPVPVPEPATIALGLVGVAGVMALRRRRSA